MKLTHRTIRIVARLLLVAGLFAQGILAAHACVSHEPNAVKALSMQAGGESCHHAESASANECLMHCTQSEQINVDHQQVTAPIVSDVVLRVAVTHFKLDVVSAVYAPVAINSGPPLTIRFCTFLI